MDTGARGPEHLYGSFPFVRVTPKIDNKTKKVYKKIDKKIYMIFDGLAKCRRRGSIRAEIPCRMQWSAKSGLSRRLFSCPLYFLTCRANFWP